MKTKGELNQRMQFNDMVDNYEKIRVDYPDELLSNIFDYVNENSGKKSLEIGAGTGKATSHFLAAGYGVTAVEIAPNMADFLRQRFSGNPNFDVITSSFEEASLKDGSYDLIYAAAAFHWVDAEIGCPKAYSLLRDGGTLAMFRYTNIPSDGDGLYEEIQEVYKNIIINPIRGLSENPEKNTWGRPRSQRDSDSRI